MRFQFLAFCIVYGLGFYSFGQTVPSISANALFLYRNSNFHKENADPAALDSYPNGFNVRETELQIFSDVDPYTRMNLLLSISPSYISDGTTIQEKWGIEPEEAFVESNVVSSVTFKLGKFKAFMGKHNLQHTHAYAFIDAPLANTFLLGDEGLKDVGGSAAIFVPTSWFNEVTIQIFRGKGENSEYNSPTPASSVGLVHWKNLVDVSDDLTAEVGVSYAQGGNSHKKSTTLSAADLTFKWKPSEGGKYRSLLWATEYLQRIQSQISSDDEIGSGIASWIQFQFAERWSALFRYDNLKVKNSFDLANLPNETWTRNSFGLQFTATEFSSYKLEFNQKNGGPKNLNNEGTENSVFVQANFTIGAHPAHAY